MKTIFLRCISIVLAAALFGLPLHSRANGFDFAELSLEELKNVEIISVSKKPEKVSEAPAAVFVITAEDIRRSGATSIPEILRLAPGMEVARIGTNSWAVTARGFNEFYANKLLVLIDGRSVYTPIFSGVFWDVQDTLISDIDRIEVIRGPGSVLWGANAVNGVINIITKKARDTQGGLFTAGAGTREPGFGSIRYGGTSGKDGAYRIYAKYFYRDPFEAPNQDSIKAGKDYFKSTNDDIPTDNWQSFRGGFRFDRDPESSNSFSFQGEAYLNRDDMISQVFQGDRGTEVLNECSEVAGGHLLGVWQHIFSDGSDTYLQFYYDRTKRDSLQAKYSINIFDADFQHSFVFASKHEIAYGLGYRFISDQIEDFYLTQFDPNARDQYLFSAFVQDEIQLIPDCLRLTLGAKFEHNDFSGFEMQPGIRMLWMPRKGHSLWAAVSRAVRSPARSDHDKAQLTVNYAGSVSVQPGARKASGTQENSTEIELTEIGQISESFPVIDSESGSENFDSENVIACEFGYRVQPAEGLWLDTSLFYNRYRGLESIETSPLKCETENFSMVQGGKQAINCYQPDNKMKGKTYGLEIASDWQTAERLRLRASYSYLKTDMSLSGDSTDSRSASEIEGSSPEHQFSLWSSLDITGQLEFDLRLRYISELRVRNTEAYTTTDIRLAWKPVENFEFSIVGQDIGDSPHSEFSDLEAESSFYGKLEWRF